MRFDYEEKRTAVYFDVVKPLLVDYGVVKDHGIANDEVFFHIANSYMDKLHDCVDIEDDLREFDQVYVLFSLAREKMNAILGKVAPFSKAVFLVETDNIAFRLNGQTYGFEDTNELRHLIEVAARADSIENLENHLSVGLIEEAFSNNTEAVEEVSNAISSLLYIVDNRQKPKYLHNARDFLLEGMVKSYFEDPGVNDEDDRVTHFMEYVHTFVGELCFAEALFDQFYFVYSRMVMEKFGSGCGSIPALVESEKAEVDMFTIMAAENALKKILSWNGNVFSEAERLMIFQTYSVAVLLEIGWEEAASNLPAILSQEIVSIDFSHEYMVDALERLQNKIVERKNSTSSRSLKR